MDQRWLAQSKNSNLSNFTKVQNVKTNAVVPAQLSHNVPIDEKV